MADEERAAKRQRSEDRMSAMPRDRLLQAVAENGSLLEFVSADFKADREIVFAAVWQDGLALRYAAHELRKDRDMVMAAMHGDDCWEILEASVQWGLASAQSGFHTDRELVRAAVIESPFALQFADDALRADREIVLAAVRNDDSDEAHALQFADDELCSDREIVLAAVRKNPTAIAHISKGLLGEPGFQESDVVNSALEQCSDSRAEATIRALLKRCVETAASSPDYEKQYDELQDCQEQLEQCRLMLEQYESAAYVQMNAAARYQARFVAKEQMQE
tara:strand:- start:115 stop:948 length:834 start_codon:yes stop_codon:yes gene_type:complete|eukprot:scaffold37411_cov75-Phaeocystis_antarctica.AAC.4